MIGLHIGLRHSFWPMMGRHSGIQLEHDPFRKTASHFSGSRSNYPAMSLKETPDAMSSILPARDWSNINWADADPSAIARWIAGLPLPATEQHGPHLPFATDVKIGEAYLARVRALLPDSLPVTFLP